ncbi:MAG: nuclease-related domain-containing protein [Glaciihabitans sp.]
MTDPTTVPPRQMRLRYAGTCIKCRAALAAGTQAVYDSSTKTVTCVQCPPIGEDLDIQPIDTGVAGASAQREGDRRSNKREARIREAHPKIGGLILALSDDPQSTKAWSSGARGEVALGRRLDSAVRDDLRVLHDRRIPGSRANIDHMVVGPSGVFVIDAKRYVDRRPSLSVEGGFFRPRVEKLMVGSRDQTKLVVGVKGQVERVESALEAAGFGSVSVRGMLCFVDGDWPLIGGDFEIAGVDVVWPGKATRIVARPGNLDARAVDRVLRSLASTFASA